MKATKGRLFVTVSIDAFVMLWQRKIQKYANLHFTECHWLTFMVTIVMLLWVESCIWQNAILGKKIGLASNTQIAVTLKSIFTDSVYSKNGCASSQLLFKFEFIFKMNKYETIKMDSIELTLCFKQVIQSVQN